MYQNSEYRLSGMGDVTVEYKNITSIIEQQSIEPNYFCRATFCVSNEYKMKVKRFRKNRYHIGRPNLVIVLS